MGRTLRTLEPSPLAVGAILCAPFLLMAVQVAELRGVDPRAPVVGRVEPPGSGPSIVITDRGFALVGDTESLADTEAVVPCLVDGCPRPSDYDTAALGSLLASIKDERPSEDRVVLLPEGDVPYEVLMATMDACRASEGRVLFPRITVSGGME